MIWVCRAVDSMETIQDRILNYAIASEHVLTKREVEVLRQSSEGMSYKEIAEHLNITARTVRFFLENARGKLNCKNTTHAVSFALQCGLI